MRKVIVSERRVFHKYVEVEVKVPKGVEIEDIENWLWLNEDIDYMIDKEMKKKEAIFGDGLDKYKGMCENTEKEMRYDVVVKGKKIYGGHL